MNYIYLSLLLFSLSGLGILDWRYRLAFFLDAGRTAITLLVCVIVFVIWDALGIALGIFYSGQSAYMSGWYLAPEFPVEEVLFLILLCYVTLLMYLIGARRWRRT